MKRVREKKMGKPLQKTLTKRANFLEKVPMTRNTILAKHLHIKKKRSSCRMSRTIN